MDRPDPDEASRRDEQERTFALLQKLEADHLEWVID